MRSGVSPERPLSQAELLDSATSLYRRGGVELLRTLFIPSVVAYGLFALMWDLSLSQVFVAKGETAVQQAVEVVSSLMLAFILAVPPLFVSLSFMSAFVSQYASDLYLGLRPNTSAITRTILKKLPSLAVLNVLLSLRSLSAIIVSGGLLLWSSVSVDGFESSDALASRLSFFGVLAMICAPVFLAFFASRDALAPIVMIHENAGVIASMKRSVYLSTAKSVRSGGTFFGLISLCLLFTLIIWTGVKIPVDYLTELLNTQGVDTTGPLAKVAHHLLESASFFVAFLLTSPIFICGQTVIYFDRRRRLEGYDIELLAQEVWKNARQIDFDV